MGRKKSIKESKQAHGALEIEIGESLYDFMGLKTSPYKESDAKAYRAKLDEMSLSDLQRHAIEVANIVPQSTSRSNLIDKLEREFLKKQNQFVNKKKTSGNISLSEKDELDLKDLLSRGK